MSPTSTEVASSNARSTTPLTEQHPAAVISVAELSARAVEQAAPVLLKGDPAVAASLVGEDPSCASSHATSSPPGPVGRGVGRPISASPAALLNDKGDKHMAGGPGNLISGMSVEELKKMTALRMANHQQQQQDLRVVSPQNPGDGEAGELQRAGPPQRRSRESSPSPPLATHGGRDRETSRETSGFSGAGSLHYRQALPRTPSSRSVGSRNGRGGMLLSLATAGSWETSSSNGPVGAGGGNAGDMPAVPPTPSSVCSSSGHSSRSGGQGSVKLHGRSLSPMGSGRRQSPAPPSHGVGAVGSSRASPVAAAMPHGLTVQELKELTKIRLAREALKTPVQSGPARPRQQQQQMQQSPGAGSGVGRGRASSPALVGRPTWHPDSRSPVPRSTSSTPGVEDRPHRRTRRGGRRGRNRSPRPDSQYSPTPDDNSRRHPDHRQHHLHHDGYFSVSPSPRARRSKSDPWADPDDQCARSSSQPRTVSRVDHQHFLPAISKNVSGGGGCGGTISPASALRPTDGPGASDGGSSVGSSGGETESAARASGSSSTGIPAHKPRNLEAKNPSGGGVDGGGSTGSDSSFGAGSRPAQLRSNAPREAFGLVENPSLVAPGSSGRRPMSLSTFAAGIGGRSNSRGGGGGGSGRSSPLMGDVTWTQGLNSQRTRDGGVGGGHGSVDIGGGDDRHQHRSNSNSSRSVSRGRDRELLERGAAVMPADRPWSLHHHNRRRFAEERGNFTEEQSQFRDRGPGSTGHVQGMIGNERFTALRGFEDAGGSASHHHRHHQQHQQYQHQSYPRMQRAYSDGLATSSSSHLHHNHHHLGGGNSSGGNGLRNGGNGRGGGQRGARTFQEQHHYDSNFPRASNAIKPTPPLRAEESSRMGDRYHAHHHHQPIPNRRYNGDSYGHQQSQRHHHPGGGGSGPSEGSRISNLGGSSSSLHLPSQRSQLVSRSSDGGLIASAASYQQGGGGEGGRGAMQDGGLDGRGRTYVGDGGGSSGITGNGGVRHGSSSSLADGDISFNVAESVLVTPRTATGSSWKTNTSSAQAPTAREAVPSWTEHHAGNARHAQGAPHSFDSRADDRFVEGSGTGHDRRHVASRHDYNHRTNSAAISRGDKSYESGGSPFRRHHEETHGMPVMSNHHHDNKDTGPYSRRGSGSGRSVGGGSPLLSSQHSPLLMGARGLGSPSSFSAMSGGGRRGHALSDNGGIAGGSNSGRRGSPLNGDSPLLAGTSFSLDLAGYTGGGGGGGGRVFGRAGSEGALSAYGDGIGLFSDAGKGASRMGNGDGEASDGAGATATSRNNEGVGDGGRGFASGLFGLDTGSGGGGGGIGASPSSHHSAGPLDAPMMPLTLNTGSGPFGSAEMNMSMDPSLGVDAGRLFSSFGRGGAGGGGGGSDAMPPGRRQYRSVSSTAIGAELRSPVFAPVGGERGGGVDGAAGTIGTIGSSRDNG